MLIFSFLRSYDGLVDAAKEETAECIRTADKLISSMIT